jgi:hypothetical protein
MLSQSVKSVNPAWYIMTRLYKDAAKGENRKELWRFSLSKTNQGGLGHPL